MVPNHALYQAKLRPAKLSLTISTLRDTAHFEISREPDYFIRMTFLRFILLLMIGGGALSARAQEAARPTVDLTNKTNEQNPAVATPTPAPPPPELPELSQLDEIFKQTSLGKTADDFRMHLEWRRLRNRVVNDPEVVAAKRAADVARTDFEKRERLRQYYAIYYARMRALTDRPEIKAALEDMKAQHLKLADQNQVRPSPSPSATTTPGAESTAEEAARPSPAPAPVPTSSPEPATQDEEH